MYQPMTVQILAGDAGVDFTLNTSGRLDRFRITLEALRDHFGADEACTPDENLKCFYAHDQEICAAAFRKSGVHPSTGRVVIDTSDF